VNKARRRTRWRILALRVIGHSHLREGHSHGGGEHSHGGGSQNARALATALAITFTYTVAEIIGGLITGSLALLADAGHMLSDNFSLGLALFAFWLSAKPPTPERSFGFAADSDSADSVALLAAATLGAGDNLLETKKGRS
jgi:Co/Zn/Cd efflux system component